ncbi:MAG: hypothetical protein A7315_14330 [Candidatus Altiarchaeales archaeon WOR_SM1_79]|nr:MAG: hypothetical protein A7315_14330 [Candidatus Altiarchaeales archaeon WOR_SM1_79]
MRLPNNKYSYQEFLNTCSDFLKKTNKKLQIVTLIFRPNNNNQLLEIFRNQGFSVDISNFGDIVEISTKYNLYNTTREVYYYLTKHSKYEEIYLLFSFNSVGDIYNTLLNRVESIQDLYYLWLHPAKFDSLKEYILEIEGSYITYFHGKKVDIGKQECKRPRFYREIKYRGDDAKISLEELQFEYGVLPQNIEFVIPAASQFKINKNGYYTLFSGNVEEFLRNIVQKSIDLVIKDNKEIEKAKFDIKRKGTVEILNSKDVKFELEQEIGFEEFEDFTEIMKNNGFSPYNVRLVEGSVIFSANIVDEKKGNIFSVTSNGKKFTIIPKYNSSPVSIIRFHRFLIEKIDQLTSVVYDTQ